MQIETLMFALGAILLLAGILGGGFELKEIKVPKVSGAARVAATIAGAVLVLASIGSRPDASGPPPQADRRGVTFTVEDHLGDGQISEQVELIIDGQLKGTLSVNADYPHSNLTVTVSEPGRYSFSVRAAARFVDRPDEYVGVGQGVLNISAGKRFECEGSVSGQTWLVDLIEKL